METALETLSGEVEEANDKLVAAETREQLLQRRVAGG